MVAALGVGHVPEHLAHDLVDLAADIPVVLTSRTGLGAGARRTPTGSSGSETYLRERGLVSGGLLDPYKARVLLKVALPATTPDEIRPAFADPAASTDRRVVL